MGLLELTKDLSNFKYTDYSQVGTAYDFMGNDHANGFTNNMAFPNTQFVGIDGSKTIFDSNNTITLGGKDIGIPQSNIPSPFSIKDITGIDPEFGGIHGGTEPGNIPPHQDIHTQFDNGVGTLDNPQQNFPSPFSIKAVDNINPTLGGIHGGTLPNNVPPHPDSHTLYDDGVGILNSPQVNVPSPFSIKGISGLNPNYGGIHGGTEPGNNPPHQEEHTLFDDGVGTGGIDESLQETGTSQTYTVLHSGYVVGDSGRIPLSNQVVLGDGDPLTSEGASPIRLYNQGIGVANTTDNESFSWGTDHTLSLGVGQTYGVRDISGAVTGKKYSVPFMFGEDIGEDIKSAIDRQYTKIGGNKGLRQGGGIFSEPFIIREIGTNDKFLGLDNGSALLLAGAIGGLSGGLGVNGSFSGAVTSGLSTAGSVSLIRGGIITQGTQAAIDQVRIGKFLLSPRGLIWNLKQYVLQSFNSQDGSIVGQQLVKGGTTIFNPLSTSRAMGEAVLGGGAPLKDANPLTGQPIRHMTFDPYEKLAVKLSEGVKDVGDAIVAGASKLRRPSEDTSATDKKTAEAVKDLSPSDGGGFAKTIITKTIEAGKKALGERQLSVTINDRDKDLQVPYGGKFGTLKTDELPTDLIKFRIRDAVNGKWIIFPAFLDDITDNSSAEYTTERYIGRPDAIHIYQGYTRNISLSFKVVAMKKNDIPIIWEKMNYLKGLTTPTFKKISESDNEMRPITPYIYLTIGDLLNNTPGYFSSVNVTIPANVTWEIDDGMQYPQVCDVSLDFVYVGKSLPNTLGKHYEIPWLKDSGIDTDKFSTFGENNPREQKLVHPDRKTTAKVGGLKGKVEFTPKEMIQNRAEGLFPK